MVVGGGWWWWWINPLQPLPQGLGLAFYFDFDPDPELDNISHYLLLFFFLLLLCLDAQVAGEEAGELLKHFGGHLSIKVRWEKKSEISLNAWDIQHLSIVHEHIK